MSFGPSSVGNRVWIPSAAVHSAKATDAAHHRKGVASQEAM